MFAPDCKLKSPVTLKFSTADRAAPLAACVSTPPEATLTDVNVNGAVVFCTKVESGSTVTLPPDATVVEIVNVAAAEPAGSPSVKDWNEIGEPTTTEAFVSMTTSSAELGTCGGDQFAAVAQF